MITSLDVSTLAFVASMVFLSITAILLLVFFTRRVYPGFRHWLLWQVCITFGVLAFAHRGPDPLPIQMMLITGLLLLAPVFLYEGLTRFYEVHRSRWPSLINYGVVVLALVVQAHFSYVEPDLDARVVVYSLARAFFLSRCALAPLRIEAARRSPSFWSLVAIMMLVAVNDLHHAWVAAQPGPVVELIDSDSVRRALLAAVVGDVLAAYVLLLMNSERLEAELRAARHDIEVLARTDSLTGLWNRRHFEDTVEVEIERARRYGTPLSLLALDADHFKRVNDDLGHHAGDAVLRELARLIDGQIRRSDLLCRWGGEEFMILVPESDAAQAAAMAEKIRQAVSAHDFGQIGRVTVSIGIGQLSAEETVDAWLRRVDAALYEAKQQGRNCVVVAGSGAPAPAGNRTSSLGRLGTGP